jgi:hypothetical protein
MTLILTTATPAPAVVLGGYYPPIPNIVGYYEHLPGRFRVNRVNGIEAEMVGSPVVDSGGMTTVAGSLETIGGVPTFTRTGAAYLDTKINEFAQMTVASVCLINADRLVSTATSREEACQIIGNWGAVPGGFSLYAEGSSSTPAASAPRIRATARWTGNFRPTLATPLRTWQAFAARVTATQNEVRVLTTASANVAVATTGQTRTLNGSNTMRIGAAVDVGWIVPVTHLISVLIARAITDDEMTQLAAWLTWRTNRLVPGRVV